jgi:8-oxo-dGTP pyrophosphatase MutT (NUDIX family)
MGEVHPEAQVNGFAGSMIIALLCNKYEASITEVFIQQMYKVFFNGRTIYLDDTLPDMTKVGRDYVCAFENITDLRPQLKQFLEPNRKGNLYIFHDDKDALFKTFRQCFNNIDAAGGLVLNEQGEILLIKRRGKWDLPKGKAEPGESPEQTALREVEEECGLTGLILERFLTRTYHIYKLNKDLMLKKTDWFEMKYKGESTPVPLLKEDISQANWIKHFRLKEVYDNTYTSIIDVIKMILPA